MYDLLDGVTFEIVITYHLQLEESSLPSRIRLHTARFILRATNSRISKDRIFDTLYNTNRSAYNLLESNSTKVETMEVFRIVREPVV